MLALARDNRWSEVQTLQLQRAALVDDGLGRDDDLTDVEANAVASLVESLQTENRELETISRVARESVDQAILQVRRNSVGFSAYHRNSQN
jgi:hypothetical protein